MTTVMSAIGEATGMKPADEVIAHGAVVSAKMKATLYLNAVLETSSPDLRHLLTTHLQDALAEHERASALAIKRGWYKADASPQELVQQAVEFAKPALQQ